ncbi:S-adenosyl-L-methionine-dependent methyltransferase [Teratosphaeria nubilosa]|uniref:Mitochondrial transcription factor 1 n=1 Tax=Teratosphaeria nubilosa TaxID=161662 RepID=A0A6G1KVZ7_9PEZI|nr:S-adenosyl-L-methionine-dependent methyltransferase [Teratosphaeria nubilosa]
MGKPTFAFNPDSRYPVTKLLSRALDSLRTGNLQRGKIFDGEATQNRHEVVSESLCDDIIGYLGPTLDQHKGCTLIDVHPGSCLWSSKLHEYLKPRRHLLMEPDDRYYKPFIKPLLDQPGSTYRWTRLPGAHPLKYWGNYETVMNDPDLLPAIPTYPVGDPRRRLLNKDVLLIGNLAREYKATNTTAMDYSLLMLIQMVRASLANAIFHQGGPVRMLWWLSEEKKTTIFPPTDISIQGVNASLSLGANINEVAGTVSVSTMYDAAKQFHKMPLDVTDAMAKQRIHESAKTLGMSKPESREWLDPQTSEPPASAGNPLVPLDGGLKGLQEKLQQARDRLSAIDALLSAGRDKKGWRVPKDLNQTMDYPHCTRICEHVKRDRKPSKGRDNVAGTILDMHLRITKLEATLKHLQEICPATAKPTLAALEIRSLNTALNHSVENSVGSAQLSEQIARALNFATATSLTPPLLSNYARSYPALKAHPHEIWPQPQKGLMLLDLLPTTHDLSVPDLATNAEGTKTAQMLIKMLYGARNERLATQLDKIALNAAQDLIPMVPEIRDARKGGRLDEGYVRVRGLTSEMLAGLARAWVEWPFRPDDMALELAAEEGVEGRGSVLVEEEVMGEDGMV